MSKKSNNKSGMSMKTKWIITGILCVLAVLTVVVVAADGCFDFKPGSVQSNDKAVAESAAPDADKDTAKTGGTHTVLVTAGNGGTTDPNGSLTVEDWESVKINFTPNEGYEIQSISVDGKGYGRYRELRADKRHGGSQHHRNFCKESRSHADTCSGNPYAG